jgi:hypothetical protein
MCYEGWGGGGILFSILCHIRGGKGIILFPLLSSPALHFSLLPPPTLTLIIIFSLLSPLTPTLIMYIFLYYIHPHHPHNIYMRVGVGGDNMRMGIGGDNMRVRLGRNNREKCITHWVGVKNREKCVTHFSLLSPPTLTLVIHISLLSSQTPTLTLIIHI